MPHRARCLTGLFDSKRIDAFHRSTTAPGRLPPAQPAVNRQPSRQTAVGHYSGAVALGINAANKLDCKILANGSELSTTNMPLRKRVLRSLPTPTTKQPLQRSAAAGAFVIGCSRLQDLMKHCHHPNFAKLISAHTLRLTGNAGP